MLRWWGKAKTQAPSAAVGTFTLNARYTQLASKRPLVSVLTWQSHTAPNQCAVVYLWLQLVRYCQLLSHACMCHEQWTRSFCSFSPSADRGRMQAIVCCSSLGSMSTCFETISWMVIEWFSGCGRGKPLARGIENYHSPNQKSVLSCHRIPEMQVLGNSLNSDDTIFSRKSPLHWNITEEGTLIPYLHLIKLVDI